MKQSEAKKRIEQLRAEFEHLQIPQQTKLEQILQQNSSNTNINILCCRSATHITKERLSTL